MWWEALLFRTRLSIISLEEISNLLLNSQNNSVAVCNANSVVRVLDLWVCLECWIILHSEFVTGIHYQRQLIFYGLNQEELMALIFFIKRYPRALTKIQSIIFWECWRSCFKMTKELKLTGINILTITAHQYKKFQNLKKVFI